MSELSLFSLTTSQMEEQADNIKTIVVRALVQADLLDEKIADEWCATHTIVLRQKSIFRTITDRWDKEKGHEHSMLYKVVKSI